jgi:hypothetical protein
MRAKWSDPLRYSPRRDRGLRPTKVATKSAASQPNHSGACWRSNTAGTRMLEEVAPNDARGSRGLLRIARMSAVGLRVRALLSPWRVMHRFRCAARHQRI